MLPLSTPLAAADSPHFDNAGGFATVRFRRYCKLSRHSEVTVEREVWFEKVAWSYMPYHWKGFAVMGAIILPTIGAIILAQTLSNNFGYGNAEWLPFVMFLTPALLFLLHVAKRNS
jgi:hypothetical protein